MERIHPQGVPYGIPMEPSQTQGIPYGIPMEPIHLEGIPYEIPMEPMNPKESSMGFLWNTGNALWNPYIWTESLMGSLWNAGNDLWNCHTAPGSPLWDPYGTQGMTYGIPMEHRE